MNFEELIKFDERNRHKIDPRALFSSVRKFFSISNKFVLASVRPLEAYRKNIEYT